MAQRKNRPLSASDPVDRRLGDQAWAALMAGVRNLGSQKQPSSSGITARDFLLKQLSSTAKATSGTEMIYIFTIKCFSCHVI